MIGVLLTLSLANIQSRGDVQALSESCMKLRYKAVLQVGGQHSVRGWLSHNAFYSPFEAAAHGVLVNKKFDYAKKKYVDFDKLPATFENYDAFEKTVAALREVGFDPNGRNEMVMWTLVKGRSFPFYPESQKLKRFQAHAKALSILIKHGLDPNLETDTSSQTPLMTAILTWADNYPVVEVLLKAGARPEYTRPSMYSIGRPIEQAAYWGKVETLKLLIKYGADEKRKSKSGNTLLQSACMRNTEGNAQVIRYLISAGHNKNEPFSDGRTPLEVAKQKKFHKIVVALK